MALYKLTMESARRRLQVLTNILTSQLRVQFRPCSTGNSGTVTIGDISLPRRAPSNPELVPVNYVTTDLSQYVIRHLRWMGQKDLLGQDIFLIGPPGPFRRTLAMQYLELVGREMEYVSLSRDTTESDLKQRREIANSTAHYVDQCAVNAALNGRVLIVDGIEKAERNVLPVINNLLENREMQLEDGRFLMAASRYDKLLKEHSKEELDGWKLVRVSEDFRVIALGLPVPRYRGHPLDPPLRSRFQGRNVDRLPFNELTNLLKAYSEVPDRSINKILSFAYMFISKEAETLGLPDFPLEGIPAIVKLLEHLPELPSGELLHRIYPYDIFASKEGRKAVEDALHTFNLVDKGILDKADDVSRKATSESRYEIVEVIHNSATGSETDVAKLADVHLCTSSLLGSHVNLKVLAGTKKTPLSVSESSFVSTKTHQAVLSQIIQSHLVGDFCVVGPKGSGKSALIKEFARILGYEVEPFVMYRDLTSRDMLQQRATLPNGDTIWRLSPLVTAALEGKLLVLDGIHRVDGGSLAVLHRLVHDRELQLYDGTRLLSPERYDKVKSENGYSDEDLTKRGILRIHPSFRIAALAEPPESSGGVSKRWLDSELLTLFCYHHLHPLEREQETYVLNQLGVNISNKVNDLLNVAHVLRSSSDPALRSLSASLSTRQLLRLSRRLNSYPNDSVHSLIQNACLARFLPSLTKTAFDSVLSELDIVPETVGDSTDDNSSTSFKDITCEVKNGVVHIGQVKVPLHNPDFPSKVPDIIFYDIPQHLYAMECMLKDFIQGEHLLLIGNQGVGKNKIVDRFLQLLNRPREYIQLHRDTTVQTLTLQPTVRDGVIVYEDSPLVRALKLGHILVVDEADKAPAHVVCVLKTLLESGEMLLSDGRRVILPKFAKDLPTVDNNRYLIMHPNFRMIVLANRPGFPFLGNDFYGSLGDIFACHPIDNPDFLSEMAMLKKYGPNVSDSILEKLARAFSELRSMADSGLLAYPYSTREAVSIVRHLQRFPNDSLSSVIKNVFDFDSYGKETVETLSKVLQKHGIPVGVVVPQAILAKEYDLPNAQLFSKLTLGDNLSKGSGADVEVNNRPLFLKDSLHLYNKVLDLDKTDHRASKFGELKCSWKLPLHYTNVVSDVKVNKVSTNGMVDDSLQIHVATSSPVQLYTFDINSPSVTLLELGDIFPSVARGAFKPRIRMATLGKSSGVFLYDEMSGTNVVVDPTDGSASVVEQHPLMGTAENFMRRISGQSESFYHLVGHLAATDKLLVNYRKDLNWIEMLDWKNQTCATFKLPFKIISVHPLSKRAMFVIDDNQQKYLLKMESSDTDYALYKFKDGNEYLHITDLIPQPADPEIASRVIGNGTAVRDALPFCQADTFANLAVGLTDQPTTVELHTIPRSLPSLDFDLSLLEGDIQSRRRFEASCAVDSNDGTFFRVYPATHVPPDSNPEGRDLNFLEVTDLCNKKVRYLPVEKPIVVSPYAAWLTTRTDTGTVVCPTNEGEVVVADVSGMVHLYEVGSAKLRHSLAEWQQMLGDPEQKPLQVTIDRRSGQSVTKPKFGKTDPTNAPHVGGNTWAGGTGGRDTAGLGGMGGPFRLDSGNPVFQVSNLDIASVPEEVRKAAREMARKAHQERLREIKMSQYDAEEYEKFSSSIQSQVKMLRVILDNLQAKGKERQWLHHQTSGELDDIKLVEGLTGERSVYKRRGEQDPEPGSPQQLPKRLKLLVDVSGSTYRFNGLDRRLERILESTLMVMEAFENYEHKFKYELIGHSGDDFDVSFVRGENIPKNNKERMDILKMMYAHSQFCGTGDNTLEATSYAIKKILDEEKADEYFVIVLSDANFDRYGISPQQFARILTSESRVNGYAIFIGSLGDQAQRLKEALPAGRAFVCLDTAEIPRALQQIFTSSVLNVGGGD